jgi:hypothetical protein
MSAQRHFMTRFGDSAAMLKGADNRDSTTCSMLTSLNLRYDLASLSDAQLAERLERVWQTHSQAEANAQPLKLRASFRGPIRHVLAYPFLSWVGVSGFGGASFGLSYGYSVQGLFSERHRALMRIHLSLCEARDITDEMQRGVTARAGGQ